MSTFPCMHAFEKWVCIFSYQERETSCCPIGIEWTLVMLWLMEYLRHSAFKRPWHSLSFLDFCMHHGGRFTQTLWNMRNLESIFRTVYADDWLSKRPENPSGPTDLAAQVNLWIYKNNKWRLFKVPKYQVYYIIYVILDNKHI